MVVVVAEVDAMDGAAELDLELELDSGLAGGSETAPSVSLTSQLHYILSVAVIYMKVIDRCSP